ncbi:MAG: DUF805 domain-containing protein [Tannerellaceae bacterium]|jgi:uncharacterized membrane protein YhaH (DUF805 family)|nr:DUF805 domain-containing protein [Tannerellaceae bacterium]
MKWYLKALRQYADFSGRARRKEYWMFVLFNVIFACAAMFLDYLLTGGLNYNPIYMLYSLGMFIPTLAVSVRRLHDIGKTGGWMLLVFIPLIGLIMIIVFMLLDGENGRNVYGPDPKNEEGTDTTSVYVPPSEFIEIPVNTAVLSALKCPQCDSKDYIPVGKKGAVGKALATQIFTGIIGNIISARSHAKNVSNEPLRYRCKKCKRYYMAEPSAATPEEHLSEPCLITLQRINIMAGAALPQVVYLNGIQIGTVKNGKAISFHTWVKENVVFVTVQGIAFPDYKFTAEPGGSIVILFNRKPKQVYNVPKASNGPDPKKSGNTFNPPETEKASKTQQPEPEAKAVQDKVTFDDNGKFVKATLPGVSWNKHFSGGSTYFSCNAPTLFQATEILRDISSIPPSTYYVVDTPDGSLGRDLNGFYTEAQIKSNGIRPETNANKTTPVEALSLTAFGNVVKDQNSVAFLKSTGQYASFILQMECGYCGYKSPVETKEGNLERQCYACGTVNKTQRAQIRVYTPRGIVTI